MCKPSCQKTSCPFAYTDESEKVQNYGCLPTPKEIIDMRVNSQKTWACHADLKKPCSGAIAALKAKNLPYKVVDKILVTTDDDWSIYTKS